MKKILIVEDDTSISEELKNLLENSGYNGVILKDFENSYEEIKRENPDLILLDINIPKLNGEMLLQKIRKESKKQEAAVFSSKVDEEAAAFVLVLPDNLTATDRVVYLPVELPAGKRCIFSLGLIFGRNKFFVRVKNNKVSRYTFCNLSALQLIKLCRIQGHFFHQPGQGQVSRAYE